MLNRIIGKRTPDQPVETPPEKPAQLVENIDFEGLSLEEFAASGKEWNRILRSEEGAQKIQQCRCRSKAPGMKILD